MNCHCIECLGSPSKKQRWAPPFDYNPPASQPIVKGNNPYGAKGTIRCLACQRRKGKCEFPSDKPELPCEHCKRKGLCCGEKLPTERKRQLNHFQDGHLYVRTIDTSRLSTLTSSQLQYRYTDEPRPHVSYRNDVAPRPVAPAIATLPEPRPSMNIALRSYHPGAIFSAPGAPPPRHRPPLLPQTADLVLLIESQIANISLPETGAMTLCLGTEHGFVGNPYITQVMISRKNQEFSRGHSWFSVQWLETDPRCHGLLSRSINLLYEPGRPVCTSSSADDAAQSQSPHQPPPIPQKHYPINGAHRQDTQSSIETSSTSSMDIDPPKPTLENADWSTAVGGLFDEAAVIVNDQSRTPNLRRESGR